MITLKQAITRGIDNMRADHTHTSQDLAKLIAPEVELFIQCKVELLAQKHTTIRFYVQELLSELISRPESKLKKEGVPSWEMN